MFINKKKHYLEFLIILIITCSFAYLLVKLIQFIPFSSNELELEPNQTLETILLEEEN